MCFKIGEKIVINCVNFKKNLQNYFKKIFNKSLENFEKKLNIFKEICENIIRIIIIKI